MATNIKVFNPNKVNTESDAAYATDPMRTGGLVSGVAPSNMHNKLFHQTSLVAATLAESLSDKGLNMLDSDPAGLRTSMDQLVVKSENTGRAVILDEPVIIYSAAITYSYSSPFWFAHADWQEGMPAPFMVYDSTKPYWTNYNNNVPAGAKAVILKAYGMCYLKAGSTVIPNLHAYARLRIAPKSVVTPVDGSTTGLCTVSFLPPGYRAHSYGLTYINIGADKEFKYLVALREITIDQVGARVPFENTAVDVQIRLVGYVI
jgi:hypothetical protein